MSNRPRIADHRHYAWYIVGMLWLIAFFNYADRQAIYAVFPLIQAEMNLDKVQLGLLGSAFGWVYGLGGPFAGWIVDRIRRKTAILWGLHVWSAICVATAASTNFYHLLFFRAAEGLGESIYFPASMSYISDFHSKRTRSRAMGIHQTSAYIGVIAGGIFAAYIGKEFGWRWSFVVFGSLGIVLGLFLRRFLIEPVRGAADTQDVAHAKERATRKLSFGELMALLFRRPTALLLIAAYLAANFVAAVLLAWMPAYLYEKFQLDLVTAGLTATFFPQMASLVGAFVGGWAADKLHARFAGGRLMVQALGVLSGAGFVALCGFTYDVTILLVALTAWGFFKGLYDANIFASMFDVIPPEARGSAVGFMGAVGWLGGAGTAPVVIGYIAEQSSLGFAIATASLVYIVAGLLLLVGIAFFIRRDSEIMQHELSGHAG